MFNDTSIIKEVNILTKVICFLLVAIALVICHDPIFIFFVDIILLLITKQYQKLFTLNIVTSVFSVLDIVYPQFMWISKLLILIIYVLLLYKVTKLTELRFIVESTLYRFNNKQITYKLSYLIYFLKRFKSQFKRMLVLKDDYEIETTPKFVIFALKQSYINATRGKKEFIETNNMRFYNSSSERTYIEKITWEYWDTNYLLCHVIILLITIFYGR